MTNPFDEDKLYGGRSALVKMTPDDQGRFEFEIWCQYTRKGLDAMQVGDLIGVENYTPPANNRKTYSILTITQLYPTHFANQSSAAYPGHVFESMRSIKEDWEKQSEEPLYPTTTIVAKAVSTGLQFAYTSREDKLPNLEEEKNLPMVGAVALPLSMEMVDSIINQGMEDQPDSPFYHKKFEELNIKLDKQALLTTHFGVFGFTGVGKSNLVSSLVDSISSEEENTVNVVLVDPNDEYLGLLIDHFVKRSEDMIYLHVGADSLPLPIIEQLENNPGSDEKLVSILRRQMTLPSKLKKNKDIEEYLDKGISEALNRTKIAIPAEDLASLIKNVMRDQTDSRSGPDVKLALSEAREIWTEDYDGEPITKETLDKAINLADDPITPLNNAFNELSTSKKGTAKGVIERTTKVLKKMKTNLEKIHPRSIMPINEIIEFLNNKDSNKILIITGRRDSELKSFSEILGNSLYEERRRKALIEPYTIFILDEGDLFIPLENKNEETMRIKEMCVTLARRGRKYGLGIGISTQRSSLLDTEVMGNLHTYFISKLPRSHDRQRVAEAFGIGEEQLSPTFTFRPGNWLIISHDATGLKGVPIPTYAKDANERIIDAAKNSRTEQA